MMSGRAPLVGWGAFLLLAIGASIFGMDAQLIFAALAIGVLGLPHGASDLAIVVPDQRVPLLVAYIGTIVAVLILWIAVPAWGLSALLLCSAIHFALDDDEQNALGWARGVCIVAIPAVAHRISVADLFATLTQNISVAGDLATMLFVTGAIGAAIVVGGIVRRRASRPGDRMTLATLAMVAVLPPLVGFSVGFVMLHALRQTSERQRDLLCPTMGDYLRRVAPVLAGAAVVLIGMAAAFAGRTAGDVGLLFAGIAALAMPHMLVTPLWRRGLAIAPRRMRGGIAVPL